MPLFRRGQIAPKSSLVRRQVVTVEWHQRYRYGRLAGNVYVKGVAVGLEQVRAGPAWHFKRFQHEQTPDDLLRYTEAEKKARIARIGLWQEPSPAPPWDWRDQQRAKVSTQCPRITFHVG
jgi:endonuclease YncB( thermonuclease family)